jgi:two-component system CheB/CheR fusion protein
MPRILVEHAKRAGGPILIEALHGSPTRPRGVAAVFRTLQEVYGIDFSHYKPTTVVRRIERRLQLTQSRTLEAYIDRLDGDVQELDALFHDLLIGVTRFFRDEEAFERLEKSIIPGIVERTLPGEEIRVWVAGCATGEEAYSIAILLQEELAKRSDKRRLRILATDVHRGSLEIAGRGLYDEERVAHVKPELLERYFDKRGPSYQVSPELRQLVVFAPHNVVKDAPFTRLDLITCRNMLIYLQPLAQKKVLNLFHFALKRQGALFLGPSENIGALSDDFETVDSHWRIYRKHRDVRLHSDIRVPSPRMPVIPGAHGETGAIAAHYSLSQAMGVYDALLDEHMPPSLLVNERRELIHAFGGAGRYLKVRDGRPSLDLWDMLAPDLKIAVTGAMQRALKEHTAVTYNGLRLSVDGEERPHKLSVRPLVTPGAAFSHVLITIEQVDLPPRPAQSSAEMDLSQISRDQLGSLEAELRHTKENLQATIEELETSNEELQAANEELIASNEELQSTNEELQSVNEELYTVNSEYQRKITELTQLTNDMDNLLASIEVGTIFLDQQLCIRKFTPLVAETFNLLPQDIGRPIAGFSTSLSHPRLMEDLSDVLRVERAIEREVRDRHGNWFFLRILPYRARGQVNGVVLTLIDMNGLKAAEDAVFRERYLLNGLMDSVPDAIYFKDAVGKFVRVNKAMASRLGLRDPAEAVGTTAADYRSRPEARAFDRLDQIALTGEAQPYRLEEHVSEDRMTSWLMTTRQPLRDREGNVVGMLGVARDVTDQKRAEDEIRLAVTRRDEFLAMLSHELRNPLSAIVNGAMLMHQAGGSSRAQAKGLSVIERQSRQMTRLLDDLLEVSRITQNKIELRKQVVDVRSVIHEAVMATREKFATRKITLSVELCEQPAPVDADPARLQQIVVNLLDNASKYNRPGGHATVRLMCEGEHAVLSVADTGAGIDAGSIGTIFEPFVQCKATLDRVDGGMGVGLTLVRSLVEMHGGTIAAKSDGLGKGSEFTMRLRLAVPCDKTEAAAPQSIPWPAGKRVVVIEDNEDSCQTLQLLLESAGYEVSTAGDGKSGIALIERVRPDMAIVDIGLPVMNGFEVARKIRAHSKHKDLYMVALTGYGQASDQIAALEAGFNEHVVKPLDPEELKRLMSAGRVMS